MEKSENYARGIVMRIIWTIANQKKLHTILLVDHKFARFFLLAIVYIIYIIRITTPRTSFLRQFLELSWKLGLYWVLFTQ